MGAVTWLRRARLLLAVYVAAVFVVPFAVPDGAPGWVKVTVAVVMVAVPVVALVALGVWWVRVLRGSRPDG
jgi:hypothetical protein